MNKSTTDAKKGDGQFFLKATVLVSGLILVAFLGIFLYGLYSLEKTQKNYVASLNSLGGIVLYHDVEKLSLESQTGVTEDIIALNNSNKVLENYLNHDVKNEFDNVATVINSVNTQISSLYTLFNNSFMILTIILTVFALIIAILGFYISSIVDDRYSQIKKAEQSVDGYNKIIQDTFNHKETELYQKIIEIDIRNIITSIEENPENILAFSDFLRARTLSDENVKKLTNASYYYHQNNELKNISVVVKLFNLILNNNPEYFLTQVLDLKTDPKIYSKIFYRTSISRSTLCRIINYIPFVIISQSNIKQFQLFNKFFWDMLDVHVLLVSLSEEEQSKIIFSIRNKLNDFINIMLLSISRKFQSDTKIIVPMKLKSKLIKLSNMISIKFHEDINLIEGNNENEFIFNQNDINYKIKLIDGLWEVFQDNDEIYSNIKGETMIYEIIKKIKRI